MLEDEGMGFCGFGENWVVGLDASGAFIFIIVLASRIFAVCVSLRTGGLALWDTVGGEGET